jgi:hypothetical protein
MRRSPCMGPWCWTGAERMSWRRRIPDRGDVAASAVADLLGLSLVDPNSRKAAYRTHSWRASLRPTCIREVGCPDDGRFAEIFSNAQKIGTAIETAARDVAVIASLALKHDVPPETIRRALTRNGDGSASGALGTLLDLLASGSGA